MGGNPIWKYEWTSSWNDARCLNLAHHRAKTIQLHRPRGRLEAARFSFQVRNTIGRNWRVNQWRHDLTYDLPPISQTFQLLEGRIKGLPASWPLSWIPASFNWLILRWKQKQTRLRITIVHNHSKRRCSIFFWGFNGVSDSLLFNVFPP